MLKSQHAIVTSDMYCVQFPTEESRNEAWKLACTARDAIKIYNAREIFGAVK